jgi:glycosyltransferase involved in cell wall biosynthesis
MSDRALRGRVLYLVGGPGNAERVDVTDLFAARLAARGLEVDYVIFTRDPAPPWRKTEWRGASARVVGRTRLPGIAGAVVNKLYEVAADLRTFWMALTGRYDIVQIRDKFVVGVLGLIAARLRGRRFVYWLSYPFAESRVLDAREGRALVPWISLFGGKLSGFLLYRIIMRGADHNFVQSERMLEAVAARGVPRERMSAVPMAVSEKLLERPAEPVEPDTILYLGSLMRVRHLEVLVEALEVVRRRRPGARLILVGDGENPADRRFLEEEAARRGLADCVEFTGLLPMHAAHDRTATAAVCVSPIYPAPILLLASPTKLIEYMALGRPVVANSHPDQTAVIGASGAGLCVEWSAEGFAEAISAFLADPAAAERMGERGRAWVRDHRVYPVVAAGVAATYRRLLPAVPGHDAAALPDDGPP